MAQKTVTALGNAQIDTAQSKFGGASGLFDGDTDRLITNDNTDWDFGSGDFTLETQVRFNSVATTSVLFDRLPINDRSWAFYWTNDNNLNFNYSTDGTTPVNTTRAWTPSTSTWYHLACARQGNNVRIFVDGTQVGANIDVTGVTLFNSSASLVIGSSNDGTGSNSLNGWMDELRISKGVARYTANFTAPTGEFEADAQTVLLLHMNGTDGSTTFTDDSANIPATITDDYFFMM